MTVYIEYVIIDNLIITALICMLSYRILKVSVGKLRILSVSILGTAASVFYPFLKLHFLILLLIKIALSLVLSFILFYKKYNFFKGLITFLLVTFMYGGIIFAIGYVMFGDIVKALTYPICEFPISLLILTALIIFLIFRKIILKFNKLKDINGLLYEIEVTLFGKQNKMMGFLDTGNRLYDGKSGVPIVIVNIKKLLDIFTEDQMKLIMLGNGEKLGQNAHYIRYNTLGKKENKILIIKPDKFVLYFKDNVNTLYDVMLGLSFNKFQDVTKYDAILHPAIIN